MFCDIFKQLRVSNSIQYARQCTNYLHNYVINFKSLDRSIDFSIFIENVFCLPPKYIKKSNVQHHTLFIVEKTLKQ